MRNKELDIYRGMTMVYIVGVIHLLYWSGLVNSEYKSLFLIEMPLIFFIMGASFSFNSSDISLSYMTKRFLRCIIPFAIYSLAVLALNILLYKDFREQLDGLMLFKALTDLNLYYNRVPYLHGHLWFIPIYLLFIPIVPLIWLVYKSNKIIKYSYAITMVAVILMLDIFRVDLYYIKTLCFYSIYIYIGFFYRDWVLSWKKKIVHFIIAALSLLLLFALKDTYSMNMQANKFPPNFMFLVYTFMTFNILIIVKDIFLLAYEKTPLLKGLIDNYSKNSFVLYLWHPMAYLFIFLVILKLPKDSIIVQLLSQPIIYGICIVTLNVINGNIFNMLQNITIFANKEAVAWGGVEYISLIRVKHWIKNSFVFVPLVFSKNLFNYEIALQVLKVFFLFSMASSLIYIINDIFDIEKDRDHPRKKYRPLASGKISILKAKILASVIFILIILLACITNIYAVIVVGVYVTMNILYSVELKHHPIIDTLIIAMGFVFRVLAGGFGAGVNISSWLFLTIFSLALFLGFGKRRNELMLMDKNKQRKVLKYYDVDSLNNFMNIFSGMFLIFYCLYSFEGIIPYFYVTIPLVVYGLLKYNLLLKDQNNEGDPTEILFNDKGIKIVVVLYVVISIALLYFV